MAGGAMVRGMVAGAAGVAAMTLGEKLEQMLTGRPNSYVPAHTLERLLGLTERPDAERLGLNWTMHWGQGILLGAVRGMMAERGFRGPVGSFMYMNLRLFNDQALENATGVGAPPWTWPADEQVIDLLHKAVYAFTTGAVADWLIEGPAQHPAPRPGWTTPSRQSAAPVGGGFPSASPAGEPQPYVSAATPSVDTPPYSLRG